MVGDRTTELPFVSRIVAREALRLPERAFHQMVTTTGVQATIPGRGPGRGRGAFWCFFDLLALRVVLELRAVGVGFDRARPVLDAFAKLAAEHGLVGDEIRNQTLLFNVDSDGKIPGPFLFAENIGADPAAALAKMDPGKALVAIPLAPLYDELLEAFQAAVVKYAGTPMIRSQAFDAVVAEILDDKKHPLYAETKKLMRDRGVALKDGRIVRKKDAAA